MRKFIIFISRINNIINDQKGAVLVFVALMLFVLLGVAALTADAGMLYKVRREMVTAADAGAIAGAKELQLSGGSEIDNAKTVAKNYAMSNKANDNTVVDVTGSVDDGDQRVEVIAHQNVDLFFAKVFGVSNKDVTARAAATWSYQTEISGDLIPLWYETSNSTPLPDNTVLHMANVINSNWGTFPLGVPFIKNCLAGENVSLTAPLVASPTEYPDFAQHGLQAVYASNVNDWLHKHYDDPAVSMVGFVPLVTITRPQGNSVYFHIDGFACFEIQDVIMDPQGNGSDYATIGDPPTKYPDLENAKASIIGRFVEDDTGKPIITQSVYVQKSDIGGVASFARLVE